MRIFKQILILFQTDMRKRYVFYLVSILCSLWSCQNDDSQSQDVQLVSSFIGSIEIDPAGALVTDIPVDRTIVLNFSSALNAVSAETAITLENNGQATDIELNFTSGNSTVILFPTGTLLYNTTYTVVISGDLQGSDGQPFDALQFSFKTIKSALTINAVNINGADYLSTSTLITDIPTDASIEIVFSIPVNPSLVNSSSIILNQVGSGAISVALSTSTDGKTVTATPVSPMTHLSKHTLTITGTLKGSDGEIFSEFSKSFYTGIDPSPQLPLLANDEDQDADNTNDLLSVVQHQTFKYFWDFAHPVSGMARERNTSGDIVTSGGSGFGIMALVVGMERNFITRTEGVARMEKIVTFLENADRFHGAWPHWINGSTGEVVPFSTKDNGGDLVETSFLVQGLLTFRQYLNSGVPSEATLADRITDLWEGVEWDWYRKENENVLYWHWSPDYNWEMNFPLYGYFEEQITYILAASSPTHGIPAPVYVNGYGENGSIVKNGIYYGYTLPLESPGPLFWVQYSYLGMDPHFSDGFANYWQQNVNATLINQAYCIDNPKNYVGYSEDCWGLTASDNQDGYSAHSPSNDLGVISPTAALSSFPYTPAASMKALKFFYYSLGDRLWGEYGFYDAFNLTNGWTADSYLAIDQGPIIIMIENYRTGLLWNLFMSAPEVQSGVTTLEFTN